MERNLYEVIKTSGSIARQSTDECWNLKNLKATIDLGKTLIRMVPDLKLLFLEGPLGAGKTSLVKGIAESLGIHEPITSPTFALAQHYETGRIPLFHLDLYRLEETQSANELFLQESEEADAIGALMVVEWPERLDLELKDALHLKLEYGQVEGRKARLLNL